MGCIAQRHAHESCAKIHHHLADDRGSIDLYFYDGPSPAKSPRTIKQVLLDCLLCQQYFRIGSINVDGDIQAAELGASAINFPAAGIPLETIW